MELGTQVAFCGTPNRARPVLGIDHCGDKWQEDDALANVSKLFVYYGDQMFVRMRIVG